ncbi:MAG: redoxin domain-containing protein [Nitrococcus sp.]|nr:redoxin domain-containing protein [Nitrococcus sp.]
MTRLQGTLIIVLAVALAAIGFGVYQKIGSSEGSSSAVTIGEPAPEYLANTLGGETVQLSDFKGEKTVMVNIWATWCQPCREEMPQLQKLYEEYKDNGLVILGVSVDGRGQEKAIRRFVESVGVTFPILYDSDKRIVWTFETIGIPQTLLIAKSGELIYRWRGRFNPQSDSAQTIVRNAVLNR